MVDKLKIASQNDKDKLKEAKDVCYKQGFYGGKMLVGLAKGELIEKAKPKVK